MKTTHSLLILLSLAFTGCEEKTSLKPHANNPTPVQVTPNTTKSATIGAFKVDVPNEWADFSASEAKELRNQYLEQSRQIYQQFNGASDDPAKSVDIAAYHIGDEHAAFILVSFTVPPQSNLISLLKGAG